MALLTALRTLGLRRWGVLLGLLVTAAAVAVPACFNPQQPGCAFSCAGDGLCPSGYSCGTDQLCHRDDGQGSCAIPTDAAPSDALPTDAAGQ
ncbi:MAG TPA: hypothetical protein VKZ18_26580 [Polyangia bacterium]|nr:hypothetical protein [Polyangia bacterium]